MNPTVTVVIPTYNRAAYLTQAVESVRAQTFAPLEIIVVDDGSTDETSKMVRSFGSAVQYLSQNNAGPAAARNLGIQHASGDLLAFLDDDDLWVPDSLRVRLTRLLDPSAPPIDFVLGLSLRVKNVVSITGGLTYDPVYPVWSSFFFSAALIRRELFARVGLIDPTLRHAEDIDWFLRTRERNIPFTFLTSVTHLYRLHDRNLTQDRPASGRFLLKAVHQSLVRRTHAESGQTTAIPEVPDLAELKRVIYNL